MNLRRATREGSLSQADVAARSTILRFRKPDSFIGNIGESLQFGERGNDDDDVEQETNSAPGGIESTGMGQGSCACYVEG